jgi:hypothetical protein
MVFSCIKHLYIILFNTDKRSSVAKSIITVLQKYSEPPYIPPSGRTFFTETRAPDEHNNTYHETQILEPDIATELAIRQGL